MSTTTYTYNNGTGTVTIEIQSFSEIITAAQRNPDSLEAASAERHQSFRFQDTS